MQLQVILVLIISVEFCISTWNINNNGRRISTNFNQKPKTRQISTEESNIDRNVREDSNLKIPQLIAKYGYPVEIHHVTTKDGFILELHRIPLPRAVPVLLIHGLFDSSSTFVIMGPDKGLAYFLYDMGYDVWMVNCRGNIYSKKHITLNPSNPEFWNYTFHEIGIYDLPASIDYILPTTNFKRLHLIGHSQGGSAFLIMCSILPEYNRKIISMSGLAPAAFIGENKSPIVDILSYFQEPITNFYKSIGRHEFLTNLDFVKRFGANICKEGRTTQALCTNGIFLLTGFDENQINKTMLPVILSHTPSGGSLKNVLHFGQLRKSGRFRQYDYGKMGNIQKYGRKTPPDYDLSKVTGKVAIYYAKNDYLTVPRDMEKLIQGLPNVVEKYLVEYPQFNHIDFVWGVNARELVYYELLRVMKLIQIGQL
ncbi:lipase 1-like [Episyrphus balteatus]|uniref:lipase 1-like n=1 Tax=Episyrphus balteatus TaxID=286459 RepID=UPI002486A46F|nr:lipase 1-like [Episyrphus balteatus]XP_055849511.1 lipase 1-like [Episyrphus balteatus]XP_055849512.1 lipase 1-like [Episyrphus balteatus]